MFSDYFLFKNISHINGIQQSPVRGRGEVWCSVLFTWRFVHLIEQVFAEWCWRAVIDTVGPAVADCLQQKRLGSCGLDSEVGKLKNPLSGGDWRPLAPETKVHRQMLLEECRQKEG